MISYIIALIISLLLSMLLSRTNYSDNGFKTSHLISWKSAMIVLLPLFFLLAFRWNVGVDSVYGNSYTIAYHNSAKGINGIGNVHFEMGYFLLSRLFASNHIPFFWFLFALSVIFILLVGLGIQRGSVYPTWSVLVFVCLTVYFDEFSSLRQGVAEAISILALGIFFGEEKSKKRIIITVTLVIVAGLFHRIAYIYLVIILLAQIRFTRKQLIIMSAVGLLAAPIIKLTFSWIIRTFIGTKYSTVGFGASYTFFSAIIAAICLFIYYDLDTADKNAYACTNIAVLIFIFMANSSALILPFRVFDALKVCYIFIIPYIIRGVCCAKKRLFIGLLIFILLVGWFINIIYLEDSSYKIYRSVFENWDYITTLY